jgi:hypothetical protein
MLGQGELAPDNAVGCSGQNLVAARAAGQIGHRGVRGRHIGPKDRAEAPPKVMGQGVVTSAWVGGSLSLTRDVSHMCSIRALRPEKIPKRSSVYMMVCV